jgi:F-type H+-transporting ATPase subunit b
MPGIAATFGITWPLLAAQILSFSIVCGLLYWLAYQPILQMLDERRQQIKQGLANADEIKARLAAIDDQRRDVLAKARADADAIAAQAKAAAKRLHDLEKQRAAAVAEQIVRMGHEAVGREQSRMRAELKREVGRLVVQTSAAVISSVLTEADEQRLAEEAAHQLGFTVES